MYKKIADLRAELRGCLEVNVFGPRKVCLCLDNGCNGRPLGQLMAEPLVTETGNSGSTQAAPVVVMVLSGWMVAVRSYF